MSSNTVLQAGAREVRRLLGIYVSFHYGPLQANPQFAGWREDSAGLLLRAQEALAGLRALDSRAGALDPALAGTSYEQAHCLEVPDEDLGQARRRGRAASCAADLTEALRTGDLREAAALRRSLDGYLTMLEETRT